MSELVRSERNLRQRVLAACRKHPGGLSTVDMAALAGVSLEDAGRLAPLVADEFRGRIQVSERGELLWSFPKGFSSRYTSLGPRLQRLWETASKVLLRVSALFFKIWIMATLVFYFVVFVLLAVAAIVALSAASMAGNSERRSNRSNGLGGFLLARTVFDLALRLWLYSDFTRPGRSNLRSRERRPRPKPLHHAVFDFVFGPPQSDADRRELESRAFAAFMAKRGGVTSAGEFMGWSGLSLEASERALLALCSRFEGRAELDEEGTLIYRFDRLLERHELSDSDSWPAVSLKQFSRNPPALNRSLAIINGVNLCFGLYFLWQHLCLLGTGSLGPLGFLYAVSWQLLASVANPQMIILVGLSLIPLSFSVLFWLIPLLRSIHLRKTNRRIEKEAGRASIRRAVWEAGKAGKALKTDSGPSRGPTRDELSRLALSSSVENSALEDGSILWHFSGFEREAKSLTRWRAGKRASGLGTTIFDSHE